MEDTNPGTALQPAYRILSDRLKLRCVQPADLEALRGAVELSLDHLRPWMPWVQAGVASLEEHLALVRHWRAGFDRGREFVYGAFEKDSGEFIGSIGLHPRAGPGGMDIGYWVRVDRIGRGYATEMAAAATRIGFEVLRLEFIQIDCEPANHASAAIPRKLGYTFDALLRRRLIWPGGPRRDKQVWSLFADEYLTSPSATACLAAYDALERRLL